MRELLLSLSSGILLGLAFPPLMTGWLALIAYMPILYVWQQHSGNWSRRRIVANAYVAFFAFHGIANWWVSSWQEHTDPYLFLSGLVLWLLHPFFLSVPFWALAWIRKRTSSTMMLCVAPFVVTCFEWLHGKSDASYPWLSTGYMVVDTPLAQLADIVGVYGLTFLIVAVNALFAIALIQKKRVPAIASAMLVCLWSLYSCTIDYSKGASDQSIRVALVQPNENPWDKWSDKNAQVQQHIRLVDAARRKGASPELVVWSETAIPFAIREAVHGQEFSALRTWCDTSHVALLTGYPDYYTYKPGEAPPTARLMPFDSSRKYDVFNAAMILQPPFDTIPVHHKSMLTPFAERMPFADGLAFAADWFKWGVGISSWGKGRTRVPLPVKTKDGRTIRVAPVICIESIYPEVTRDFVHNGADVLCVITNDAWYNGTPGPRQHYCIARMRAIETRRDVIRCGNSGITGIIRADGVSVAEIPPMTAAVGLGEATVRTGHSVYMNIGDVIPWISAILTLVAIVSGGYIQRQLNNNVEHQQHT